MNKLKKKNSSEKFSSQSQAEKVEKLERTGESFLPDINARPSSRKKLNLPKPSELVGSLKGDQAKTLLKSSMGDFSSTGFTTEKPPTPTRKEAIGTTATSGTLKSKGTLRNNS